MFDLPNHFTNAQLDIARGLLNGLLVLANIVVWAGVYFERDKFSKRIKDFGWATLLIGLAGETLAALMLWQVDSAIISRQGSTISAIAGTADKANTQATKAQAKIKVVETDVTAAKIDLAATQGEIGALSLTETTLRDALKHDIKLLLQQVAMRNIDVSLLVANLAKGPKSRARIWFVADTADGYWFANGLMIGLREARWDVQQPEIFPPDIPEEDDPAVRSHFPSGFPVAIMRTEFRTEPRIVLWGANAWGITVLSHGFPDISANTLSHAIGVAGSGGSFPSTNPMVTSNPGIPAGEVWVVIADSPGPVIPPGAAAAK